MSRRVRAFATRGRQGECMECAWRWPWWGWGWFWWGGGGEGESGGGLGGWAKRPVLRPPPPRTAPCNGQGEGGASSCDGGPSRTALLSSLRAVGVGGCARMSAAELARC